MKSLQTLLLVTTFAVAGIAGASAESAKSKSGSMAGVSAATHCIDAAGSVQLKSAMKGSTGSAAADTKTSGSSSTTGSHVGSSGTTTASDLPRC